MDSGPDRDAPRHAAPPAWSADDLKARDIDHRHVVGEPVGGEQVLAVGRQVEVPDAPPDQQVLLDLEGGSIDHGHAIGRTQRDEGGLAVQRQAQADRLNELRRVRQGWRSGLRARLLRLATSITAYRAPDLGGHPEQTGRQR